MADIVITPANVLPAANAVLETGWAGATILAGQVVYRADSTDWPLQSRRQQRRDTGGSPHAARHCPEWRQQWTTAHHHQERQGDDRRYTGGKHSLLSQRHAGRHLPGGGLGVAAGDRRAAIGARAVAHPRQSSMWTSRRRRVRSSPCKPADCASACVFSAPIPRPISAVGLR